MPRVAGLQWQRPQTPLGTLIGAWQPWVRDGHGGVGRGQLSWVKSGHLPPPRARPACLMLPARPSRLSASPVPGRTAPRSPPEISPDLFAALPGDFKGMHRRPLACACVCMRVQAPAAVGGEARDEGVGVLLLIELISWQGGKERGGPRCPEGANAHGCSLSIGGALPPPPPPSPRFNHLPAAFRGDAHHCWVFSVLGCGEAGLGL